MWAPGNLTKAVRSKTRAVILTAAVFMALPSGAYAQDRAITIDEAYKLAIANHERVAIAGEDIRQAEADLRKTISRILPNLTAEGSYTRYTADKGTGTFITQPESSTNAELRLTQPLYSGGREWATQRQAKLQIKSSREGLEGAKEDVLRDTSRAYYGALKAMKTVEIQKAALRRALERLDVAP